MPIFHIIVIAIIQGLTEFIPVSSSGHLILVPTLLGWADQGRALDVAAHIGSLLAVLVYFRQETGRLVGGTIDLVTFKTSERRDLVLKLAVASIPLVLMGVLVAASGLSDFIREEPRVIAFGFIFFGVLLWFADKKPVESTHMPSGWRNILMIGAAQALAVIPGTSRSGITITAARWLNFDRENAARFSMLLAIPAIMASGAYETVSMLGEDTATSWADAAVMILFSFAAAYLAIGAFLALSRRTSFTPFVIYRIAFGLFLFAIFSM